jgi:hypothetical protein
LPNTKVGRLMIEDRQLGWELVVGDLNQVRVAILGVEGVLGARSFGKVSFRFPCSPRRVNKSSQIFKRKEHPES